MDIVYVDILCKIVTIEIWMQLSIISIAFLVSHKLLPQMIIETREKEGSQKAIGYPPMKFAKFTNVRYFDGRVCMCTFARRIPSDKSSADGTFDRTGNCICNIRKLQTPFTGESKKKAKPHEESQGQPVAITCSSLQPRS